MQLSEAQLAEMLQRLDTAPGGPASELTQYELISMLQTLIDSGRIYAQPASIQESAWVFSQAGWVAGYDPALVSPRL